MSKATVELDFFAIDNKEDSSKSRFNKLLRPQRSFRDIQSAISKIDPELLKSVIASGSANPSTESGNQALPKNSNSVPSTPKEEQTPFPALPVYSPLPRPSLKNQTDSAPLTIFYNGTVAVFDVPQDKAEIILKLAQMGISKISAQPTDLKVGVASADQPHLLDCTDLNGDFPISRKKSLQRFLEKRKERLTSVSPFSLHA